MTKERVNEILGFLCLAVALFVLWSLFTYDPADNAFFTSHPNPVIKNGAGIIGAFISYCLIFAFGWSAYMFPLIFIFWAVSFLMQRVPEKLFFKVVGFIIFQSSTAALFALLSAPERQFAMGGIWGFVLAGNLDKYFGFGGSLIIAISCFLLSFILATEFLIFPFLSKGFVAMMNAISTAFTEYKESRLRTIVPEFAARGAKPRTGKVSKKKEKARPVEETPEAFEKVPKLKVKKYDPRAELERERVEQEERAFAEKERKRMERAAALAAKLKKERDKKEAAKKQAEQKEAKGAEEEKPVVSVFSEHKAEGEEATPYAFPPLDLLQKPEAVRIEDDLQENSRILESCLKDFDIDVRVTEVEQGPVITRYELMPAPGVKVSRITALQDDIALVMKAPSIRIQAPIPGKAAVGIEVPNSNINVVYLRELLGKVNLRKKYKIPLVFGKDTSGKALISDLTDMPHLLIAGATGSGKTVCINALVATFFYCLTPDELKLIMIDPKRVELANYNDIPYMLSPVVTDPKKAAATLNWVVNEMENRYKLFASVGVRNIHGYNTRPAEERESVAGEEGETLPSFLPYIIVIVDELADLMLIAADKVETAITRLAQLSRATGIHLVLATQRPSVDVITGVIKANFPARVSFKVASKTDSRTVLDANGADMLLGKGDMLLLEPGRPKAIRAQGTFVTDAEIGRIVKFMRKQRAPEYNESIQQAAVSKGPQGEIEKDEMFDEAVRVVLESNQASVSILQRRLRLGYTRAARIIDQMEAEGIVGPYQGSKPREILLNREEDVIDNA